MGHFVSSSQWSSRESERYVPQLHESAHHVGTSPPSRPEWCHPRLQYILQHIR